MREIACCGCGSAFVPRNGNPIVFCPKCGTRNEVAFGQKDSPADSLADSSGRVRVQPIGATEMGEAVFASYVPDGWSVTMPDGNDGIHEPTHDTPCVMRFELWPPSQDAWIAYTHANGFQHGGPETANGMGSFHSQAMARLGQPQRSSFDPTTFTKAKPLVTAAAYCDEMVSFERRIPGAWLVAEEEPDAFARRQMQEARAQGRGSYPAWLDWSRRIYGAEVNGIPYRILAETRISSDGFNLEDGFQAAGQQGQGLLGALFGQAAQPQAGIGRYWQIDYELLLAAPENRFGELRLEFERVRQTIRPRENFGRYASMVEDAIWREQAKVQAITQNAMQQMALDNAMSAQRRQAIIQDAHDYGMNAMYEMQASNAATMDRVAGWRHDAMMGTPAGGYGEAGGFGSDVDPMDRVRNLQSEAIRGVNTYYGTDGEVYEADVKYDHLYQYGPDDERFVASQGESFDPGVDWTDLQQTDGRY